MCFRSTPLMVICAKCSQRRAVPCRGGALCSPARYVWPRASSLGFSIPVYELCQESCVKWISPWYSEPSKTPPWCHFPTPGAFVSLALHVSQLPLIWTPNSLMLEMLSAKGLLVGQCQAGVNSLIPAGEGLLKQFVTYLVFLNFTRETLFYFIFIFFGGIECTIFNVAVVKC